MTPSYRAPSSRYKPLHAIAATLSPGRLATLLHKLPLPLKSHTRHANATVPLPELHTRLMQCRCQTRLPCVQKALH
eukprot:4323150-Amphidinium_carterae.1